MVSVTICGQKYDSSITELDLSCKNLTKIPERIGALTNLRELLLGENKITEIPISILNCRRLTNLRLFNNPINLDIRIQRFINRMKNYNNYGVYNDGQNVHSSSIQNSVKQSINNLMADKFVIEKDRLIEILLTFN